MSNLWTVTINRLQLVTTFDKHGKKIGQTTTKVPVTFCDLPYATAQMYLSKAPDDTVIVQQLHEAAPLKRFADRKGSFERKPYSGEPIVPAGLGSEELEFERETMAAAKSGDFAAAITAEVEAS